MGAPLYLDLFDDGIPRPGRNVLAPLSGDDIGFESRLANTLRFQMLLAVLFDRKIIVPEAWAVSSPMFLRVAGEFLEHYRHQVVVHDAVGARSVPSSPPFVVAFGPQAREGSTVHRFAYSLWWRLSTHRRLMFSQSLSGTPAENQALGASARLAATIKPLLRGPAHRLQDLPALLQDSMARNGESAVAEQLGHRMTHLMRFLQSHPRSGWLPFDAARYEKRLWTEVHSVRAAVASLSSHQAQDQGIAVTGLSRFFRQIEAQQSGNRSIMALWQHLMSMDLPAEDKATLEAFGRYVLNRAYASALGATAASSISFEAYARGPADARAGALLDRLLLADAAAEGPAGTPVHDFVAMASEHPYDLVDTIEWSRTWQAVADFALSPGWKAERNRLLDRMQALTPVQRLRAESWYPVFDRINAALHGHLQILPDGDVARMIRLGRKLAARAAEQAQEAAQGDAVTSLSVSALQHLVDRPVRRRAARLTLVAERQYRRTLASRTGAAMWVSLYPTLAPDDA